MFEQRYLSVSEVAHYLGIGRNKAYKLCKKQDFPTIKIGNKILIDKQKLDDVWLRNAEETALKI